MNKVDKDAVKFAFVCFPFSNVTQDDVCYARECARIVLDMGYVPLISSLYYAQIFDNNNKSEMELASSIIANDIVDRCSSVVMFEDYGVSDEMRKYVDLAKKNEIPVRHVFISG